MKKKNELHIRAWTFFSLHSSIFYSLFVLGDDGWWSSVYTYDVNLVTMAFNENLVDANKWSKNKWSERHYETILFVFLYDSLMALRHRNDYFMSEAL